MVEIVAIVEGETEQTFVRDQLASHLGSLGAAIWAVLPGRHRNRGGIKKWDVAKQDIIRTLKEGRYCTTMFDYYAMPESWPGRTESKALPWDERAAHVEARILADVVATLGADFNPRQLIPYVQLHEFEALTFAETKEMAAVLAPIHPFLGERSLADRFQEILDEKGHPEAINDGHDTCPSRRITGIVPAYRKRTNGPIITQRIGLATIRARCDHFADWLAKLEAIGGQP